MLKLEGEVKPKVEVSFKSFTCPISVKVPSLGWSCIIRS